MNTRFLTSLSTTFSPFNTKSGRTARHLLATIPSSARSTVKINIKQLPMRDAGRPSTMELTFSDGAVIRPDLEELTIDEVVNEVNRLSRKLARLADLKG